MVISMDKHDRILEAIEKLCRFCPVCGKELVPCRRKVKILNRILKTIETKVCPEGHTELFVGGVEGPDAIFEICKELYADVE